MPFASGAVSALRPAALAWSRILRTALLSCAILSPAYIGSAAATRGAVPAQITFSARSALISESLRPSSVSTSCVRSEEHTSELQSQSNLVCRLLLEKKKKQKHTHIVNIKHAC